MSLVSKDVKFSLLVQAVDPPDQFVALAKRAEELGFSYFWVADSGLHARYIYAYLALAAFNTQSIQIGTGITNPILRHPGVSANAIATIDAISGGRAVMGVGAGDRPLAELGYRPAPVKAVREMITVSRRLFAKERFSFDGDSCQLVDAKLHFPERPDLPIYVAASGPKMLALGGEVADGVFVQVGVWPACLRLALESVASGAARADRPLEEVDVIAMTYGSVRDNRRQAMDESRPFAAWIPQTVPTYCEVAGISRADMETVQRVYQGGELHEATEAANAVTDEMIEKFTLSGTPSEVRDKVSSILAAGMNHIAFFSMGAERVGGVERFAEGVMAHYL
jgi:5,10-methylenetetrahydromethanopterin reductase